MTEIFLAIIGTIMFAIPLIMIIFLCNKTCKEINDSFEKEKQLCEEYYKLEKEKLKKLKK